MQTNLKLAALGGPNTFGGDAANRLIKLFPEFTSIVFFPTAEEGMAFGNGQADGMCAPQQMAKTGFHKGTQGAVAAPGSKVYVVAEVTHTYHCSLLVKPGSKFEQIKRVVGHTGSVTQSQDWLAKHLPKAEVVIVHTNSMGAAQQVRDGDGSVASVGTPGMAREMGLQEIVKEIDGGSVGSYWALSPHKLFSERPTRLVVAGRLQAGGILTDVVVALGAAGFGLQTVYAQASGKRLYEYRLCSAICR